jgi:hypothetical protein
MAAFLVGLVQLLHHVRGHDLAVAAIRLTERSAPAGRHPRSI